MATINFVLQGKGGVGKSLIASLLAQHYQDQGVETLCFDTDPVNRTFTSFKALNVEMIDILENGRVIEIAFDGFIEKIIHASEDTVIIIDNGASTFLPLCAYLMDNDIFPFLRDHGHTMMMHTVVTGGQGILDTMNGLQALTVNFPDVPVVVWLNEYFGKTEMNGVSVEDSKVIQNAENVHAFIRLKELNQGTFGHNFARMLKERLTFREARENTKYDIMCRQRLVMIWRDFAAQIDQACL